MKLENARGTRDFLPEDKIQRDKIVNTLREIFETFGYSPLETPVLERFDVLSSKYTGGAEILKETFKLTDQGKRELGLRYDLTVPLARVIGQNPNLKMPFKRYQIDKVWRDGPINLGRYREFLQTDVDVVGIKNINAEVELIEITRGFFQAIRLDVLIKINSRKILNGILEFAGIEKEKQLDATLIIDKLDKIGLDAVKQELRQVARLDEQQVKKISEIFSISGKNEQKIISLKMKLKEGEAQEGLKEIDDMLTLLSGDEFDNVIFDPSLARGLAYYTGAVFEVVPVDNKIKSTVAGGGRYDKMIASLLEREGDIPAVGISFGVDRIIDALELKADAKTVTKIFVIPIKTYEQSLEIARRLRKAGIKTDIDMQGRGPSKNLDYANALGIPHVLIIGETELKQNKFKLKDMKTGKEELLSMADIVQKMKE